MSYVIYDELDDKQCLADKAIAQGKVNDQQLVADDLTKVQQDLEKKMTELDTLKKSYSSTYTKTRDIGSVVDISPVSDLMDDTEKCLKNMADTLDGIKTTCDKDLESALKTLNVLKAAVESYDC